MKRQITLILALIIVAFCGAQPTSVKNAQKAVFSLTTYSEDGSILSSGHGIFITPEGIGISNLKPFLGCSRAVVTDAKGKDLEVTRIIGANELYNVAIFKVEGKVTSCPIVSQGVSSQSQAWLVPYSKESQEIESINVKDVETFMDIYSYYIFPNLSKEDLDGCPFVNNDGEVIALAQSSSSGDVHGVDAKFINSLQTSGLSYNDYTLSKIGIAPSLPKDKDQALLMLMMIDSSNDSQKNRSIINDFIEQYPTMVDGYSSRAQASIVKGDFASAKKDMETCISKADKKDEAHHAYSQLIYNKEVFLNDMPFKEWSLDKAQEESEKAYEISPQDLYLMQLGRIKFAKGEYQEAYDIYMPMTKNAASSGEMYYEASLCKQMLGAPASEVIALLDSAIANTDTLRIRQAAPYFFSRAEMYNQIDSFRQAVFDYTRYEILVDGQVNSEFYYIREQAEVKSKLYQQALMDIAHAIYLSQDEPMYYAEKASLELKVNMLDDALATATKCVEIAPDYPTGYLLLGLAQLRKDDKTEGLKNMEKARDMGEPQASEMIDKYFK